MKPLFYTFLISLLLIINSFSVYAQSSVATLSNTEQVGDFVEITINVSGEIHNGARRYVLHINDQVFMRSQQATINGKPVFVFSIPVQDFKKLPDNAKMAVVYGFSEENVAISTEQHKKGISIDTYFGQHWLVSPALKKIKINESLTTN